MADSKLTPKQERFCQEYLIDCNATQAAIRAGYSAKTAEVQGPRLLGNVRVSERIAELRQKQEKRTEVTQDRVLNKLASIGFGSLAELEGFRGTDQIRSLELLGKHLGMFKDTIEHTGKNGGPIVTHELSLSDEERSARIAALLDQGRARRAGSAPADDTGDVQ